MSNATFHRLASRELIDAARYYQAESPGLGATFIDEVERCVRVALEYPRAAPVFRGKIRRKLTRAFPFGVLYRVTPNGIRVLAIMNLKRQPEYWVGRE